MREAITNVKTLKSHDALSNISSVAPATHCLVNNRVVIALALLIGLAVRLVLVWQPVEELSWRVTADDAYYYFRLAQSLSLGEGATLDSANLTNGFHPLYALLLIPVFQVSGHDLALAVHLALTLVSLLNVATAYPIYLIGKMAHGKTAGTISMLLYILNPWSIILTSIGVKSAIYLFCFAWAVLAYLRWRSKPNPSRALMTGIALGLTIMARSEGGLLLFGILIDAVYRGRRDFRSTLLSIGTIAASAALVCMPWAVWSLGTFERLLQASSAAISLHTYSTLPQPLDEQLIWYVKKALWFLPRYGYKILLFNFPTLASIGFLALHRRDAWVEDLKHARSLWFLCIPFLIASIYYNLILFHQQHWYFNALVLIPPLLAGPMLISWLDHLNHTEYQQRLWTGMIILSIFCSLTVLAMWHRGLYVTSGQHSSYTSGRWIAESPYRADRFATTDSGIIGYYCQCSMTNLDGVMNNSAYEFYKGHRYSREIIGEYLETQDIDYVVIGSTTQEQLRWGTTVLRKTISMGTTGWMLFTIQD